MANTLNKHKLSILKSQLATADPEKAKSLRSAIGREYEKGGAFIRARWNYRRAKDKESFAKSFENQSRPLNAAEYYSDAAIKLGEGPETAKTREELFRKSLELYQRHYEPNSDRQMFIRDFRYEAKKGLERAKYQQLSEDEKKKIGKKKKNLEGEVDEDISLQDLVSYKALYNRAFPNNPYRLLKIIVIFSLLIIGLTYIMFNMTGNIIENNQYSSYGMGGIYFILIILGSYMLMKKRKSNDVKSRF